MIKKIKIVDEFHNPLGGAHVRQPGRGFAAGSDGIGYINSEYPGKVTISHVGTKTKSLDFNAVPSIVVMEMDSLDEVVITNSKNKETPKYLIPAIGAGLLLIALMSFGEEAKEVTL